MKLSDIVRFRKDLLFEGAVQLGWFQEDRNLANKAAEHYVFHGPQYHGVVDGDLDDIGPGLVDTATFTLDILERITGQTGAEPFTMAIAGYGTGKSHLAITLACLLSDPNSLVADKILDNITMADVHIGKEARHLLNSSDQPFLAVPLNGMQDFDLSAEIVRQVLHALTANGLDTAPLEDLRPRFRTAVNFTESFIDALADDFAIAFGQSCDKRKIIADLKAQNEETFSKVNDIYREKMGSTIRAVGQESLHDFIRVTKETYCGPGRPFRGIVIIFDEFGRYLEFSVQKRHIAGSGALQQLFECVQANDDGVFLLCFIQYELKAYIARIAPELRDDLNRYVTRYDSVRKVRLSTNMETLIANLLEKRDREALDEQIDGLPVAPQIIQASMQRWFPDMANHALWLDEDRFDRIISRGCWPLHPCSTWALYSLTAIGKSLQQRSALSLFAEVYQYFEDEAVTPGMTIDLVDLCNEGLINEFLASERYGQQGATAHGYETVLQRYRNVLSEDEKRVLKGVLVSAKIGMKTHSREEYMQALSVFSGLWMTAGETAIRSLESEYAVLEWNDLLNQYEIAGDAIPRKTFLAQLKARTSDIDLARRASIFTQKLSAWGIVGNTYNTDFGSASNIATNEWNYRIHLADVSIIDEQINFAMHTWRESIAVDMPKGQLIYCYVGPESNIETVKENTLKRIWAAAEENGLDVENGLPLAVLFLHDEDGTFGQKLAELWVLHEQERETESQKYMHFVLDRKRSLEQEIRNQLSKLQREQHMALGTNRAISGPRIKDVMEQLFGAVYPKRIPFPFDGFSTARGNAAKDSGSFTRQLFVGALDRDWITVQNMQQRNRAYEVLDRAWGVIGGDGGLRRIPLDESVRHLIDILVQSLIAEEDDPCGAMGMGEALHLLCMPPYGCNIASAGLLLAYFIGVRKDEVQLYLHSQPISIEKWLEAAMPGHFLSIPILEATGVVRVPEESLSEWETLLEEWELEDSLSGKVDFLSKDQDLEKRIPIPQQLYYKRDSLRKESRSARSELRQVKTGFDEALEKIQRGIDRDDLSLLSWGAAGLEDIYGRMIVEPEKWTGEQIQKVEAYLAESKQETCHRFDRWLPIQKVVRIEDLGRFRHTMLINVGGNLSKLGLEEQKQRLERHVEWIEEQVEFLAEIHRTTTDIENMILSNVVTAATKVFVLNDWLRQAEGLAGRLDAARQRADFDRDELDRAAKKLRDFKRACEDQLSMHRQRAANVYDTREIASLSDIANWRNEVTDLLRVFEGQELDVEDLKAVQTQLHLAEMHCESLADSSLDDARFEALLHQCKAENNRAFAGDVPPLDNERIYESIAESIGDKRRCTAANWMKANLPRMEDIEDVDASTVVSYRTRLQNMPPLLSERQREEVNRSLESCANRINQLEVEGALALFNALSDESKTVFIREIAHYIDKCYAAHMHLS